MITIIPNSLYTRQDLLDMFRDMGVNWDSLCHHVKPTKINGNFYVGHHILEALYGATATASSEKKAARVRPARKAKHGGELIDTAMQKVKGDKR